MQVRSLHSFLNNPNLSLVSSTAPTSDPSPVSRPNRPPPPPGGRSVEAPLNQVSAASEQPEEELSGEAELQCAVTSFYDAESDLASIFSPMRHTQHSPVLAQARDGDIQQYKDQISSLELDVVTLMEEMDALNMLKKEADSKEGVLQEEMNCLAVEIDKLKSENKELKDNVSGRI